ncbi:hypothetical protein HK100_012225 [Physocladia obscura]|uniref:Intradiol ring-cleavage dioxygenases domain-containing protein n=1 Tax=Physocladia obscura TaxID=109957 RepID=A0AAD5T1T9_9FUNG|nr:hypothetical protein HK100_012225 [Physocladia obscura]
MKFPSATLALSILATLSSFLPVASHPGQAHVETLESREFSKVFRAVNRRSLSQACGHNLLARDRASAVVEKREQKIAKLRAEVAAQKKKRDLTAVLSTSHLSSKTGLSQSSSALDIFGDSVACILEPEVTYGPYYVEGEYVRTDSDMREDQEGVNLYLDVQVIDTTSCTAVPDIYIELWHCNATGVYSGVVASGNGNTADTSNLDKTFLRGLFETDADGIAEAVTIFPGHYTSRATHVHVITHINGTLLPNNTYTSTNYAHVGQIFFDQALLSEVEATAPYTTNTQDVTLNSADTILAEEAASTFDPVVEYVLLGDSVSDGVFAWISIGINTAYNQDVSPAAYLTANGGVSNSASGSGSGGESGSAGGSGGPGNGTTPSGAAPSGGGFGGNGTITPNANATTNIPGGTNATTNGTAQATTTSSSVAGVGSLDVSASVSASTSFILVLLFFSLF